MFYLVGRDECKTAWRVLKIDRTEPTKLSIVEDPARYTEPERDELLGRIHDGNRATGGLKFVTKCYGIAGMKSRLASGACISVTVFFG